MNGEQLELQMVPVGEIEQVCRVLKGMGWVKASKIITDLLPSWLAGSSLENCKRKIRACAEESEGRIMSWPGSPGYKLATDATAEELAHWKNATRSQVDKMLHKLDQIDNVISFMQPAHQELQEGPF
jgi:hypothetical protein